MLLGAQTVRDLAGMFAVPVSSALRPDGALATTRVRDLWQAGPLSPREVNGPILDRPLGEVLTTHRTAAFIAADTREKLFRTLTVGAITAAVGGRVPAGIDPDANPSELRLGDLLRFLTVRTMAGYVGFLLMAHENGTVG